MLGQHVSVTDKGEYLLATCPPFHNVEQCRACIDGVYDALELFDKAKILADFTATPEPIPIMAKPRGRRLPKRFAEHGLQLAVVVDCQAIDTRILFDDIAARNQPVNLSLFADFDTALAWLINWNSM